MRIMAKIATAFRGGVRESAELVIDANCMRIFAQEIHECENHIRQTKQQLASIIAEKKRVGREVVSIQKGIGKYESRIATLLEQGDEDAALKLAQQVSEKESYLERNEKHYDRLNSHQSQMHETLQKMINKLENFRSEYRMAQSTGKMQSAQSKLSSNGSSAVARFTDMQESLDRIRSKQQQFSDEMTAMDEIDANLSGVDLQEESDLKASANDVLSRIKNRAKKTSAEAKD